MPAADVLCVPGGMGITAVIDGEAALGWVKQLGERARWVTSVCTGALIRGAAGLLRGYKATTHWAWPDLLALHNRRAAKIAPNRDAELRAVAARRGSC